MQRQKSDPDLGLLDFQDVEGLLSYNCKMTLPISRKQVEVFFETNSEHNLPTVEQKKFIQHVVNDYDNILLSLRPELPNEINIPAGNINSFLREHFDLDTIGIARNVDTSGRWDLSLVNHSIKSMSLLANFENFRPIKVWVERQSNRGQILNVLFKLMGR